MSLMESKAVFSKVVDGKVVLVFPITRLDCLEDTADVKNSAVNTDFIPIVNTADGQMEKISVKDLFGNYQTTIIEQTLTNAGIYPFNTSTVTVPLPEARANTNYTVHTEYEVLDGSTGGVKEIVVTDKLVNGFKLAFAGGAARVKVKCYVTGGR